MNLQESISKVRAEIKEAEKLANRREGSVLLLAVSKKQTPSAILDAHRLGIDNFGENYVQEAKKKIESLGALPLVWHFIGPIQSNKTKSIAHLFDWVHSINRPELALLLNQARGSQSPPLQVCIQVNVIEDKAKSGIPMEKAWELARLVSSLPNLQLRGLMTILPLQAEEDPYLLFHQLKDLLSKLNQALGLNMDTLSMGMSEDFVAAIKAGSTLVRIGRSIFGEREK